MYTYRRTAASACLLFALVGCAHNPVVRPLNNDVANAIQPIDIKIGIPHQELHAEIERSKGGQVAAASCGAIPGIGLLLAAACGGAAGAVDASVNSARAKAADETVRPLKDEIVDVNFNQIMTDSLNTSLQSVPGMQPTSMTVTNTVTADAYEEIYRASAANGVMFVNVDYYLTPDFSTLEMTVNANIFPRSAAARKAAKLSPELPSKDGNGSDRTNQQEKLLASTNSAYHTVIFYDVKLPRKAETQAEYVAAWKTDGARKLRAGIADGIQQISRLLAEDLRRRFGDAERPALSKVEIGKGPMADVIAENENGKLLRFTNGTLHYHADAAILDHLKTLESTATISTPSFAPQKTVVSAPNSEVRVAELPKQLRPTATPAPAEAVSVASADQPTYAAPQKEEVVTPAPQESAQINVTNHLKTPEATGAVSTPSIALQKTVLPALDSEVRAAELSKELRPTPPPAPVETVSATSPNQSTYVAPQNDAVIAPTPKESAQTNIAKVEFKLGISSSTVERMAKQSGCESTKGAGLISNAGPVEQYRVSCQNGTAYLAKCELRQCSPMQE
jgi:hypothetical protein